MRATIKIIFIHVLQAQKLMRLTGLSSSIPVTVIEHDRLNTSKGVIMCRILNTCSEEEICQNLKNQGVTEVYSVKIFFQGVQKPTGTYFLTFSSTKLPEEIKIAYLNVKVSPYCNPTQINYTIYQIQIVIQIVYHLTLFTIIILFFEFSILTKLFRMIFKLICVQFVTEWCSIA